jgi:hypothetical protein
VDEGGVSFTGLADRIRSEMRSQGERVERRVVERLEVAEDIDAISVAGFAGRLSIVGSNSTEVVAELVVDVAGLDESEAAARAQEVTLALEPTDGTVAVHITLPADTGPSRAQIRLDVPERLRAHLQVSGGPTQARRVAGVVLDARGDVRLRDIPGLVTGEHRAGDLRVTGVGAIRLTTQNSGIRVEQVDGDLELDATEGRVRVRTVGGDVQLRATGNSVSLDDIEGPISVQHSDGRVVLEHVRSRTDVIGERSQISLRLEVPVPARAETHGETLDIVLPTGGGVDLDATTNGGTLDADGLLLEVIGDDRARRVVGPVNGGGPTITAVVTDGNLTVRQ